MNISGFSGFSLYSVFMVLVLTALFSGAFQPPVMAITITDLTNAPDPFTPGSTTISFTVAGAPGDVHVAIYNDAGVLVRRLYSDRYTTNGGKTIVWNGRDDTNTVLPAGTYSCRVRAGMDFVYNSKIQGSGDYFAHPFDVCTDATRNVYVVNTFGNEIHKYNYAGNLVWKKGFKGSGGSSGSEPQLDTPHGICTDGTYLYVADTGNLRVQRLDMDGAVVTPSWYYHDPNSAYLNEGTDPITKLMGMDYDNGWVYVAVMQGADSSNQPVSDIYMLRIRTVNTPTWPTNVQKTRDSTWGDLDEKDGVADIAVCPNANRVIMSVPYYAITSNRSATRVTLSSFSNGTLGNFGSNNRIWYGLTRYTRGTTDYVVATNIEDDNIERYRVNNTNGIQDNNNGFAFGTGGSGTGQFVTPCGVAHVWNGTDLELWVVDTGNNRIQKWINNNTTTTYQFTIESEKQTVSHPTDLFIDSNHNLFVAASGDNRILKFDQYGNNVLALGKYGMRGGEGDVTTFGRFHEPQGVCVDSAGNIFVSDTYNERIFKYNSAGTALVTAFSGNGVLDLDGQWGGTGATENDWPYGMDISDETTQRLFWYHGLDAEGGVARCNATTGGTLGISGYSLPDWQWRATDVSVGQTVNNTFNRIWATSAGRDERDGIYWSWYPSDIDLYRFGTGTGNTGTPIISAARGVNRFTGITKDIWDNLYVCSATNNRLEVYRVMNTNYPTITDGVIQPPTQMVTEGSSGASNGQFDYPSGVALAPDMTYAWVSDFFNNRIQKFDINFSFDQVEFITISAAGPPTLNAVSMSGTVVTEYPAESLFYARAGSGVTFTLTFSKAMDTAVLPTVKYVTQDGYEYPITAVSGAGYTNGWVIAEANTWLGTVSIPTGHDGTATLSVRDAQDAAATLMTPNPDTAFTFIIDTIAPAMPAIDQPTTPTTDPVIQVTGSSEANVFVDCYNYNAATGGTLNSSQLGILSDSLGKWLATSIDLDTSTANQNWLTATSTDRAGNTSTSTTPRLVVFYTEKQPGQATITPPDDRKVGYSGTWTIRYVAATDMNQSTVTLRIPFGWTLPHETPGIAGYCTVSAGIGMNLVAAPNDIRINPGGALTDRDIVVSFSSADAGAYFDIVYGASNPPGSAIGSTASLGSNIFLLKSSTPDADPEYDDPWNNPTNMMDVNDPSIYVFGEDLEVFFNDSLSTVGTVLQGKLDLELMTLKFTNYNLGATDKVTSIRVYTQNNFGTSIDDPSQFISSILVKDAGTTYASKTSASIETSGGSILLDMTANPLIIPPGTSKTVQVRCNISGTAPAGGWIRFSLPASTDIKASDLGTGLDIGIVAKSPQVFPTNTTTTAIQIAAGSAAANLRVLHTSTMPLAVSKGSTNMQPMQLTFTNPTVGSYDVKITELVMRVERADGTGVIPSSIISAMKLEKADGTATYIYDPTIETSGTTVTLDLLINPIIVANGTPQSVNVKVDIASGATQPDFRLNLQLATSVKAYDTVGGTAITVVADPADLSGPGVDSGGAGFPDMPAGACMLVQEPAISTIDTLTVTSNPSPLYVGTVYEVNMNIIATAGRADSYYVPAVDDLIVMINGLDQTSEFTITPLSAASRIPAGTTFTAKYSIVQDKGTTTGPCIIDAQSTGDGFAYDKPALYDWNDHIDDTKLGAFDTNGATTPFSGTISAPSFQVSVFNVGNHTRYAGETRVELIDMRITNQSASTDTVTGITVENAGTALDAEVALVAIYNDSTDNADAAGDVILGSAVLTAGVAKITFGTPITLNSGQSVNLLIGYDVSTTIRDGATLDCRIPVGGIVLGTNSPITGFVVNSVGVDTIDIIANRVVCYPSGSAGTGGFYTVNVEAQDATGNVDISPVNNNVTINLTKSGGGSPIVSATSLVGGTTGAATTTGNLTAGKATVTVTDATSETVTVTPISAYPTNTACTVLFANLFTVTPQAVTGGDFAPGATNILVLKLSMANSTGGNVTLNNTVLNNIGTGLDAEMSAIKAWYDSGDGLIGAGDTLLGTGTLAAGTMTLSLGNRVLGAGNHTVLIGVDIPTSPLIDRHTLDLSIPINGITYNTGSNGPASVADSTGLCSIQITATKVVITAADGVADVLETEVLTVSALDAWNNIDINYSEVVQITCTGNAGNHGTVQATTLNPGVVGTQVTNGTLTNGVATVTITDDLAETVQIIPNSPFPLASDIGTSVTFSAFPPVLLSVTVLDSQRIQLTFDKTLQSSLANTQTNYLIYENLTRTSFLSVVDAAIDTATYKVVTLTTGQMRYPGAGVAYVVEVSPNVKSQSGVGVDDGADNITSVPPVVGGDNANNDGSFTSVGTAPPAATNVSVSVTGIDIPDEGGASDVKVPNFILFPSWSAGVGTDIAYTSKANADGTGSTHVYKIPSSGTAQSATRLTDAAMLVSVFHGSRTCWDDAGNVYFAAFKLVSGIPYLRLFRVKGDGTFANFTEVSFTPANPASDTGAPWYDPDWVAASRLPASPKGDFDRIFCSVAGDIRAVNASGSDDNSNIVVTDFKQELYPTGVFPAPPTDPLAQFKNAYAFQPIVWGSGATLKMAFSYKHPNSYASDIFVLTGLNDIITEVTTAPTNITDARIIRVTNNGNATFCPSFSPDGTKLAYNEDVSAGFNFVTFQTDPVGSLAATDFNIYMQDLSLTGAALTYPRQIVGRNTFNESYSMWAPSGDKIVTVYQMGTASGDQVRLNILSVRTDGQFGASGGVLVDNGYTSIQVVSGELSADTKISIETPTLALNPAGQEEWLVNTGIARTFYPTGASFGSEKVYINVAYPDANDDGIVDGLGLDETKLRLYYWDDATSAWIEVGGTVYAALNYVRVPVNHFSTFAIFGRVSAKASAPYSLTELYNYPNPAGPAGTKVKFGITHRSKMDIRIYDKAGDLVRKLLDEERDPWDGEVAWDLTNEDGREVANGVYIMRARATYQGERYERINKIAVIR
jgi:flagellar hook assembly protein FlgD